MKAPGRALPRYQTIGQFSGVLSQRAAAGLGLRRPYSAALGRQHWEMPTGHGDSVSFSHDGSTLVMDSGTLGVRQTLQSGHTQWLPMDLCQSMSRTHGCRQQEHKSWFTGTMERQLSTPFPSFPWFFFSSSAHQSWVDDSISRPVLV